MKRDATILMTLMGLEIGGAETHVVELSKALQKKGYRIIVASNGGVYEKELLASGIKHYRVPMHQRNVWNMIRSYFMLKKIVKKEHVDLVHSHARIPGFICGQLHKRMKFSFVTSAHGVFYTGMGLRYLTNWGQKVVAVSEDIREYLRNNYHVRNENIFVTVNGIDTDKFSPAISGKAVRKEFHLSEDTPTLVHVSRMDEATVMVTEQLISLAPALAKAIPGIRMLLVGAGERFEDLKAESARMNAAAGREVITMTGARTDVNALLSVGDVFVGVSRAALEAMAAKKAVVLAGNEGYIGTFTPDKLELAMSNNFCCRGCEAPTAAKLEKDILGVLQGMTPQERDAAGAYSRSVIMEYYSVQRMAEDCVKAYDAAWRESRERQYHIVMSGYYGFNNTGDEAIMLSMHHNIQAMGENYHITVLSNRPKETSKRYNIEAVYRFGIRDVYRALKWCDVLLSGGGSLLQDSTSTRSLLYYLSITACAKALGKKVMLYANGIGPVSGKRNRRLVKQVVNRADLITLREENSYEELLSMGVKKSKCFVTADPVFTMNGIAQEDAKKLLLDNGIPMDKPLVAVSVRNWKNIESFTDEFAKLCDTVVRKYDRNIVFIAMQVPNDYRTSEMVQKKMQEKSYILRGDFTPYDLISVIGCMDFILGMRLHTLIFAARKIVPLIGFVYDPKIKYYLSRLDMPDGGSVKGFDLAKAEALVDDIISHKADYVKRLEEKSALLCADAHRNERYLEQLLQQGRRKERMFGGEKA